MAWEEFDRSGTKGMSGDKPIDEFALALNKAVRGYEDRFDRKPTMPELLYAIEVVLDRYTEKYFPQCPSLDFSNVMRQFSAVSMQPGTNTASSDIDPSQYQAAFTDISNPPYHVIFRLATAKNPKEIDVVKVPTLKVENNILICQYEILTGDLTSDQAEQLIRVSLLHNLSKDYYASKASIIEFTDIASGYRHTTPYVK